MTGAFLDLPQRRPGGRQLRGVADEDQLRARGGDGGDDPVVHVGGDDRSTGSPVSQDGHSARAQSTPASWLAQGNRMNATTPRP